MTKEEVPSVNPKLDYMCEMLKTIHDLNEKNKVLEAQIEEMKRYLDCEYCEHYTQRSGCKNCNEEIRNDWKLKEIKEK